MSKKEEKLNKILDEFKSSSDVIGSAIVRRDGLMVLSKLPSSVDSRSVAAMAAAIIGTGETASHELDIGDLSQVVVESDHGKLISIGAGKEVLFTALIKSNANMGLVLMNMEKSSKKISRVLG